MSNFNEYFKNHGAQIMVTRFLGNADAYNPKKKITSLKHSIVEEEPKPASYYIENGLTATHKVRVEYTINDDPEILLSEFEVPKEIDGAFIIEGAYRIATNKLSPDYDCRIKMSGSGEYIINFDYDRRYDIHKQILKVKQVNPETGVPERALEIKYEDIDTLTGDKKELLKLTDRQSKKFQIKLDLDYKPEYITTKLIQECLAFGDDRLRDLVIDKTIDSVPTGFMQFLFKSANNRNYYATRRQIQNYFIKQGKLQEQITSISRLAFRFFKGTQEAKAGESNLQVPPGVNAVNLQSLGSKITIPQSTAFNATFADLIDLADYSKEVV